MRRRGIGPVADLFGFWREKDHLLSRIVEDLTVGSLRDKKESRSTRRGLHVGTRYREFPQIPRGWGFSLLGFYTLFKCFSMFLLV